MFSSYSVVEEWLEGGDGAGCVMIVIVIMVRVALEKSLGYLKGACSSQTSGVYPASSVLPITPQRSPFHRSTRPDP